MNTSEAKQKLFFYRGPIDDADPQFQEALVQAGRDPELAEWLAEQTNCYNAIRSKLREVESPSVLAEKIIRQRSIPSARSWNEFLKLAAAIVISVSLTVVGFKLAERNKHSVLQGQEI